MTPYEHSLGWWAEIKCFFTGGHYRLSDLAQRTDLFYDKCVKCAKALPTKD